MNEPNRHNGSVSNAVEATVAAYAQDAGAYSLSTAGYSAFPGLLEIVEGFMARLPAHARIIDLGCGGGRDSRFLAANGYHILALDLCEPLLVTWAGRSSTRAITPLVADMRRLPFADATADGALAIGSFIHLEREEVANTLSEVHRSLSMEGCLLLTVQLGRSGWIASEPIRGRRWFNDLDEQLAREYLTRAGFGGSSTLRWG